MLLDRWSLQSLTVFFFSQEEKKEVCESVAEDDEDEDGYWGKFKGMWHVTCHVWWPVVGPLQLCDTSMLVYVSIRMVICMRYCDAP